MVFFLESAIFFLLFRNIKNNKYILALVLKLIRN